MTREEAIESLGSVIRQYGDRDGVHCTCRRCTAKAAESVVAHLTANPDVARVLGIGADREAEADRHCPSCICGRRAPVQGEHGHKRGSKPPGTVAWWEHLKAYEPYAARYGTSQSPERLAERAGFGYWEMTDLLGHEPTTWSVRPATQAQPKAGERA